MKCVPSTHLPVGPVEMAVEPVGGTQATLQQLRVDLVEDLPLFPHIVGQRWIAGQPSGPIPGELLRRKGEPRGRVRCDDVETLDPVEGPPARPLIIPGPLVGPPRLPRP